MHFSSEILEGYFRLQLRFDLKELLKIFRLIYYVIVSKVPFNFFVRHNLHVNKTSLIPPPHFSSEGSEN